MRAVLLIVTRFAIVVPVLCVGCGPNSEGAKLAELEDLYRTIPVFQSFAETSVHRTSKGALATISKSYKSDAPYDEVKAFYTNELTKRSWEYSGERSIKDWGRDFGGHALPFQKNGYRLSIFYSGENPENTSRYAIEMVWGD